MRPTLIVLAILACSPCFATDFLMRDGSVVRGSYDPDSDHATLRVRVGLPSAYFVKSYPWTEVRAVGLPSGQVDAAQFRQRLQAEAGAASDHHRRMAVIDAQARNGIQAELDRMRADGFIDGPALARRRTEILASAEQLRSRELIRFAKSRAAVGDEVGARGAVLRLLRSDPNSAEARAIVGPDQVGALLAMLARQRESAARARQRKPVLRMPARVPHIATLEVVGAQYASWDHDADVDGLAVLIQPRDAAGRLVTTSGRLAARLFVYNGVRWKQIESWSEPITLDRYDELGMKVRLEYRVLGRPGFYASMRWGVLEVDFFPNGSDRAVSARADRLLLRPWRPHFRPHTPTNRGSFIAPRTFGL